MNIWGFSFNGSVMYIGINTFHKQTHANVPRATFISDTNQL